MQNYEHERHPIKRINERYHDSNEEDQLIGDQKEEIFEEHQHALESERKPSVKRIVRHRIENNEVKHPASSNVIDKIFSKEYSKLFKNVSSDGSRQNNPVTEKNEEEKGIVINKRISREQSNLFINHQNDSGNFINRGDETERKEMNSDPDTVTEQNRNSMKKIFVTDESEVNLNHAGEGIDSSVKNVNRNSKEHNFLGQRVGSEVMSQDNNLNNKEAAFERTFEDKSTNHEENKEYAIGNEINEFYDDYSHHSQIYDDYYENKEYGVNYNEEEREYSDQNENIQNDFTYDATVDILDDKSDDEGDNKNINVVAVKKKEIAPKEKEFDVTEMAMKRDFTNYETEFEADLRKKSQNSDTEDEKSNLINNVATKKDIGDETLRTNNNSNSETKTHSSTNGHSHSANQLERISNLEIDHKLNFTIINQTKVKKPAGHRLFFISLFPLTTHRTIDWRRCLPCTLPARRLTCLTASL